MNSLASKQSYCFPQISFPLLTWYPFPFSKDLVELLDKIAKMSYPQWLTNNAPFLPPINLRCATRGAKAYLLGTDLTPSPSSSPSISQHPSSKNAPSSTPSMTAFPSHNPSISASPSLSAAPSSIPSSQPSDSPSTSFQLPIKPLTVSGLLNSIVDSCSSDSFRISGGYNSTAGKLAINIVAELGASTNLADAINGLASMLGGEIFLDKSFFDELASQTEAINLGGTLLVDLTIEAMIPSGDIGGYTSSVVSVTVNRFQASAFLRADDVSLDFPISLPKTGVSDTAQDQLVFSLNEGSFLITLGVNLQGTADLSTLFSDERSDSTNIAYGSSFNATFPLEVNAGSTQFGVILYVENEDVFNEPLPEVDYTLELCPMITAMKNLFDGLQEQFVAAIRKPFDDLNTGALSINFDKVSDFLVANVTETMASFSNSAMDALDSIDCDGSTVRRFLRGSSSDTSLASTIKDAITAVNQTLNDYGITVAGTAEPYFDGNTFIAGVDSTLDVTITQTVSEIIEKIQTIQDFFDSTFNDDDGTNNTKLGLDAPSSSPSTGLVRDIEQLVNETILSANFNLNFLIEVNMNKIVPKILNGSAIADALLDGIGLRVKSWGASASLITDPINVNFTVAGTDIKIRDSSFALAVELSAPKPGKEPFFATARDLTGSGSVNRSALEPNLVVPLFAEIIVDLDVSAVTVSSM